MRALDLTDDLVMAVERVEPDPGPEPGFPDHTDAELAAWAKTLWANRPAGELWLFAYGSLIWNPEFPHEKALPARAIGWHRRFCLRLTRWRGTRERPGLMLALDRGGSCTGLALSINPEDGEAKFLKLLGREVDGNPPTNVPRWIGVRTAEGSVTALAFVADPHGRAYDGNRDFESMAEVLATAAGHWGSCASYLQRTVKMLEQSGLHDASLWALQRRVAELIHQQIEARSR